MKEIELTSANIAEYKTPADWNVEVIAEQILSDLNGAVALSTIEEVINEVIPKYRNARIQMFVPIFIRRDAVDQLKAMQAFFAAPAMEAVKAMIDSEIIQEQADQEAVEALVAADLVEEAVADDVAECIWDA